MGDVVGWRRFYGSMAVLWRQVPEGVGELCFECFQAVEIDVDGAAGTE